MSDEFIITGRFGALTVKMPPLETWPSLTAYVAELAYQIGKRIKEQARQAAHGAD